MNLKNLFYEMRCVLLAAMFFVPVFMSYAVITKDEAGRLAIRVANTGYSKQLIIASQLADDDREMLCKTIRAMASKELKTMLPHSIEELLIILDDQEATSKGVAAYLKSPGRRDPCGIFLSGNPHVIELVAPVIFQEEEYKPSDGDVFFLPISYDAPEKILEFIMKSPAFSEEVVNWARRNVERKIINKQRKAINRRDVMRDWWLENEKAFQARDYKAVRPGRDIPLPPAAEIKELVRLGLATPDGLLKDAPYAPSTPAPPSTPPPPSTPSATPTIHPSTPTIRPSTSIAESKPPRHGSNPLLVAVAVAGTGLLLVFGFFISRRRS